MGVIEALVSHGADLNVQSFYGQTSLHHAIILCYIAKFPWLPRDVHSTITLNTISADVQEKLPPERALVIYLLEQGASPHLRDSFGKTPLQYVWDSGFNRVILRWTAMRKPQQKYEEVRIILPRHQIDARIPSSEPLDKREIYVKELRKTPADLILEDNEVIIASGLQMTSPGLKFNGPVKVTMAHCADFSKPERAVIVLYIRQSSGNFTAIASAAEEVPRCVVREKDLDVYIGELSELWIVAVTERHLTGKRLMCIPYIPTSLNLDKHNCITLLLVADLRLREEKIEGYKKACMGQQLFIGWREGDLTIRYLENNEVVETKKFKEKTFCTLITDQLRFKVRSHEKKEKRVDAIFSLEQSTVTKIGFRLDFEGSPSAETLHSEKQTTQTHGNVQDDDNLSTQIVGEVTHSSDNEHADCPNVSRPYESVMRDPGARPQSLEPGGIPRDNKVIDDQGGELSIPSYGFTLSIPSGALKEGTSEEITLEVLTNIPENIHLQDGELVVSHGYKCRPSGIQFRKPVSLVIPHCAVLDDPRKVETALYSWTDLSQGATRYSHKEINCTVSESDFTLIFDHFSGGLLTFLKGKFLKGKLMSCMPYLPRTMPSSRQPVLEVRLVNKPHGKEWKDVHGYVYNDQTQMNRPVKDTDDEVFIKRRNLTMSCQQDQDEPLQEETIEHSSLRHKNKYTVYFDLNFCNRKFDESKVLLTLEQKSVKDTIKFLARFEESASAMRSPQECGAQDTPTRSSLHSDDEPTSSTEEEISDPSKNVDSNPLDDRNKKDPGARPKTTKLGATSDDPDQDSIPVTSEMLTKLSAIFPTCHFNELCDAIGVGFNEGHSILAKHKGDFKNTIKEILEDWRDRAPRGTYRKRAELNNILDSIDRGGLCTRF